MPVASHSKSPANATLRTPRGKPLIVDAGRWPRWWDGEGRKARNSRRTRGVRGYYACSLPRARAAGDIGGGVSLHRTVCPCPSSPPYRQQQVNLS